MSINKCYVIYSDLSDPELILSINDLLQNPKASYRSFYANFIFWTKTITPKPRRGPTAKGFYIGNTFIDPICNNFYLNRIDDLSLSIKVSIYNIDVSQVYPWNYMDLNKNAIDFYIDLFKKLVILQ